MATIFPEVNHLNKTFFSFLRMLLIHFHFLRMTSKMTSLPSSWSRGATAVTLSMFSTKYQCHKTFFIVTMEAD